MVFNCRSDISYCRLHNLFYGRGHLDSRCFLVGEPAAVCSLVSLFANTESVSGLRLHIIVCWAVILPFLINADLSSSAAAEFYGICTIYSLGLLSIIVITVALIIELEIHPKAEALAYENES